MDKDKELLDKMAKLAREEDFNSYIVLIKNIKGDSRGRMNVFAYISLPKKYKELIANGENGTLPKFLKEDQDLKQSVEFLRHLLSLHEKLEEECKTLQAISKSFMESVDEANLSEEFKRQFVL